MTWFFSHRTRTFAGLPGDVSKREHDRLERLEATGRIDTTAHPPEKEIRLRNELCAKRDISAEIVAAEAAVRKDGYDV